MPVIGIDPDLHGALVLLDDRECLVSVVDMPTQTVDRKRSYDPRGMIDALDRLKILARGYLPGEVTTVYIERTCARPAFRLTANGEREQLGGSYANYLRGASSLGWAVAACALHLSPPKGVMPSAWQKSLLPQMNGHTTHARALLAAGNLWPSLKLTRPKGRIPTLHGRACAALIALYGLRLELLKARASGSKNIYRG